MVVWSQKETPSTMGQHQKKKKKLCEHDENVKPNWKTREANGSEPKFKS